MLFELLLLIPIALAGFFFVLFPIFKYVSSRLPSDPVKDAKKRVQIAQSELEAARLNKEAEKLYEEMYQNAMKEYDEEVNKDVSR